MSQETDNAGILPKRIDGLLWEHHKILNSGVLSPVQELMKLDELRDFYKDDLFALENLDMFDPYSSLCMIQEEYRLAMRSGNTEEQHRLEVLYEQQYPLKAASERHDPEPPPPSEDDYLNRLTVDRWG